MTSAAEAKPRVALLVLGMHRSGTSALTRLLALHGAALPARLIAPKADNPRGFFEADAVWRLNDRLLVSAGLDAASAWADPRPLALGWEVCPSRAADIAEATALLRQQLPGCGPFVLKDPRMCRLLAVWLPAIASLGATPHVVLALRNPLSVAASLAARNGIARDHALLLWLAHVLEAERATRGLPRATVHYEDVIADWRTALSAALAPLRWKGEPDAAKIEAFLAPELRHHGHSAEALLRDAAVPMAVKAAYLAFRTAPVSGPSPEALEEPARTLVHFWDFARPAWRMPLLAAPSA